MSNIRYYIIYNISNTFIVYICVICLIYLSVNDIVLAYNVCKKGFTNERILFRLDTKQKPQKE